jgi:hypothetical protein
MSKILKNTTGSSISISDTGVTIPASPGSYTIPATDYLLWAASDNIVTQVGAGNIIVNDGSVDLSISDGVDVLKGLFPSSINVNTSSNSPVITKQSNTDAFGRSRVSSVNPIFDYNFSNVVDFDLYWSQKLESGATATHIPADAHYELAVTTTIGSKAVIQSRRHMEYYTGKSHIGYFTGNPNGIQQGMRKCIGLYNENQGYFFEITDTGVRVVVRKGGTDTVITSTNWNGDKLDGTGESGITVDETKQQLYFIDIAWLGSGQVRFGRVLGGGMHVIVHTYQVGNVLTAPYTTTAVLPFRVEIECIATATVADKLQVTCFSYLYEGAKNDSSRIRNWNCGLTGETVNTTQRAMFGIRINSTLNEASIKMVEAELTLVSGNSEVRWELLHNPVITGTPTWNNEPNSVAQTLSSPTTLTYSGGYIAASGYITVGWSAHANLSKTDVVLGHDLDHVYDVYIIVVETLSSNSKVLTEVQWKEFS